MIVIQVIVSRTAPFYCILLEVHLIISVYITAKSTYINHLVTIQF